MKKIYALLLCLLGFGLGAFAQTPELLYYNFEGSGTSVPNLATMPPTGTATATLVGAMSQGSPGICNGALLGTGGLSTADYLNTGWAPALGNGAWTVSFRTSNISSSSTLFYIFGDPGTSSWRVFTNGVAGPNNWIMRGPITDVLISGGAVMAATMNTWVYDPVAGNVKAYLDGVLVNTVTQPALNVTGAGPLKVGAYGSNTGLPLGGRLDDLRVYNRALSAQEVLDLYNGVSANFLGPDTDLCVGDTLSLLVPVSGGTVLWSDSSTADTLWVTQPGTYSVGFSAVCASGTDTIVVGSIPVPTAGFAGMDSTICTGDSVTYSTGFPTASHVWSSGDTTETVTFSTPGNYTVTLTNQCGSFIDTVNVIQSALVYTSFIVPDSSILCDGDTAALMSANAYDTYLWSSGGVGMVEYVTTSGTYTLQVSDACGSGIDSVAVMFGTAPTVGFTSTTNMMTANFTSSATGSGTIAYSWSFGDGNVSTQQNPSHTYAANGTYVVTLTVTNDCGTATSTDTVMIDVVGMEMAQGISFDVYPNPAQSEVSVSGTMAANTVLSVRMVNSLGQLIAEIPESETVGTWMHTFNLRNVPAGIYYLQVTAGDATQTTRLVVQH